MKTDGNRVYIRYPDGNTISLSVPGGLQCSNFRGEIVAICTAAEHPLESGKQMGNIAIFTYSLSTLQALNSADPDQMIQGLHSSLAKLTAQFPASLRWVPAHVGLTGNETADRLANKGSQSVQTQTPVTYKEAKALLHSRFNRDWKKDNGGYQAHLEPICRLEPAQQTAILHLHTGHYDLRAHLKRSDVSDTSLCECGQADQTPDHILQSYPEYANRCQQLWPHGADLATKLWGLVEDLTRRLVLWHQPDWRYDLNGYRPLKKCEMCVILMRTTLTMCTNIYCCKCCQSFWVYTWSVTKTSICSCYDCFVYNDDSCYACFVYNNDNYLTKIISIRSVSWLKL